jgi:hypothetical protein
LHRSVQLGGWAASTSLQLSPSAAEMHALTSAGSVQPTGVDWMHRTRITPKFAKLGRRMRAEGV